jgi:hypothetical protein
MGDLLMAALAVGEESVRMWVADVLVNQDQTPSASAAGNLPGG